MLEECLGGLGNPSRLLTFHVSTPSSERIPAYQQKPVLRFDEVELSGFDLPVDGAGRDARQARSFVCCHHADALPARPAPTLRRDPAPADGHDAVRLDGDLCASFRKPVSLLPDTLRVAIMSASALPRPASCAKISAVVIDPVPCIRSTSVAQATPPSGEKSFTSSRLFLDDF
jgi:hypothetical protein